MSMRAMLQPIHPDVAEDEPMHATLALSMAMDDCEAGGFEMVEDSLTWKFHAFALGESARDDPRTWGALRVTYEVAQ